MANVLGLDPAAFFDEFYRRVFSFVAAATGATAADVEDLVQETLLEAWRQRDRFRGDAAPLTWVLAIAKNRIRMRRRSRGRQVQAEEALRALRQIDAGEIPEDLVRCEESVRQVRRALEALEASHAEVLIRRYFEGKSIAAIAQELGESGKAVESRLHRARQELRDRLKEGVEGDDA